MAAPIALLEREDELATIVGALDGALGGAGSMLLVEGEAGAGKTSLLEAAAQLAGEREMRVLRARGGEYERDFPYGVVRQLFEPLLAEPSRRASLLSGTAAMAAPVFEQGPVEGGGDPFGAQHGLYWLMADLATGAPLVLLVDDLQWADLASLRALVYVARRFEDIPVAALAAVRAGSAEDRAGLLAELSLAPATREISPRPLSVQAAAELAGAELGRAPSERFATACQRLCAGNPFLVGELLQALKGERVTPTDENAERLGPIAAAGVAQSVRVRLARLGEPAVEVARATAILEPNAELAHVAALSGLGVEEAAKECSRLVEARLLRDGNPSGFVHPLVRHAVYTEMPAPRRGFLHSAAAERLTSAGGPIDSIAAHLLLAPPTGDSAVVSTLRAAASEAVGRGAPEAGVEYLRRALREPPAPADRAAVARELGVTQLRGSDGAGIETLLDLRAGLEDGVARAEIVAEVAISMSFRSRIEEAVSLLEESIADLAGSEPELEMRLRAELGELSLVGLEGVPDGLPPDPIPHLALDSLAQRRLVDIAACLEAIGLGTLRRAEALADSLIADRDALRADALVGFPSTRSWLTLTLADRGERLDGLDELMLSAARERHAPNGIALSHGTRAYCRGFDGDLLGALPDAETAVALTRESGIAVSTAFWRFGLISVLTERGELGAAAELLPRDPAPDGLGRGTPGALAHCIRGRLHSAIGSHDAARNDFLAAAERVEWLPNANPEIIGWRPGLAQAEAALGNAEEARRLAAEAVEVALRAEGERGIGLTLRVQGAVDGGPEGIEILRESAEILAGTRARLQHAHALVELGAALRRANHRREAREPLREGLDLAHRCGAAPLEERARTELAATGARPRKAVLTGVDSLTPSELRVARMAAEGMTNREIAQQLYVTAKTVETHLRHVYRKLGVAKRGELAGALR